MTPDTITPDASTSWVDRLPAKFRPYLRLMRADRPVGVWLLFIPCLWGILIARPDGTTAHQIYGMAILMAIGAFVMRSAGCIYNDIIDRDVDAQITRTANRPLAAGTVSIKQAWALVVALSLVGLVVLIQFNRIAIFTGIGSLFLVAAYPFMKRITWWPQAWLGLTFNWGVLVGGAAISGAIGLPVLLIYGAGIFWTLGYDTIYAHQDREDDALVGVKSTARRLGGRSAMFIALFFTATITLTASALFASGARFWLVLLVFPAVHFAQQIVRLNINDGDRCLHLFKSNVTAGLLLAFTCLTA